MHRKRSFKRNDFNSIFTLFKNILLLFYFISMKHLGIFIFKWRKLLVRANSFNSLFTRPSIDSIPRKLLLCLQLQREYKSMWNDKYNARGKFYFPRWESIDHAVPCIYEPVFHYENIIIYDENFLLFFFFLLFYLSPSSSWNARKIGYDYTQKSNSNRSIVNKLGTNRVIFKHRNIS